MTTLPINPVPMSRSLRHRFVVAAAVLVAAVAALFPLGPASADTDQDEAPLRQIAVTKVDAITSNVRLYVSGAADGVGSEDVSVTSEGAPLVVNGVGSSETNGVPTEVVIVVDTNARAAQGQWLDEVKTELLPLVDALPATTSVGIIAAGDSALIETRLTADKARLAKAIDDLSSRNSAVLINALDRAGSMFSDEPGVVRSVLLVATGADTGSQATIEQAQVDLIQHGAQVVTVSYDGGEPRLQSVVAETGGHDVAISVDGDTGAALDEAIGLAADRLLVTFSGEAQAGERVNVNVTVSGSTTQLSYPAGILTDTPVQLAPIAEPSPSGLAFFRTSAGLYVALVLAFIGIAAGIWSLGSIMAGGESSLDGVLSRYSDGTLDVTDPDEMEELIVQSALLQRAVSFSEDFAEKRGFLARVEDLLERANLPIRAGEAMFILAALATLSAGLGLALTRSALAALLLGLAAAGIALFVVRFLGRRRFKAFESQLPDTLQLLSGTLRAGYSLPQGFEVVSKEIADPMGQELRRAMTEARLGREIEESLSGVAERMSSADFAWAVMAIGIQREVGGNLSELLMSVSDTMIARERLRREIGALTAEGKLSAGVLSALPPGLGVIMWILNPEYVGVLFSEFLGNVLLGLGTVSALIGLAWMKKVITVDV
jgi:tight adherence protein B